MTEKLSLIESIVNENAVDFRQIVNRVLLEKLSVRLDEEYKGISKNMFVLSEGDEEELEEEVELDEETEEEMEEDEDETEEDDEEEAPEQPSQSGGTDHVRHSYGAY